MYIIYGVFLAAILIVNLLYIFQVFKYRLKNDASLLVLALHLLIIIGILATSTFWLVVVG